MKTVISKSQVSSSSYEGYLNKYNKQAFEEIKLSEQGFIINTFQGVAWYDNKSFNELFTLVDKDYTVTYSKLNGISYLTIDGKDKESVLGIMIRIATQAPSEWKLQSFKDIRNIFAILGNVELGDVKSFVDEYLNSDIIHVH